MRRTPLQGGCRQFEPVNAHHETLRMWQEDMETGLFGRRPYSPRTIEDYTRYVTQYLSRHKVLSVEGVKAWLRSISRVKFATREKSYKALLCYGRYLLQEKLVSKDLLEELAPFRPLRFQPPRQETVKEDAYDQLRDACTNHKHLALITLLFKTGIRAGEAANLMWLDVHLDKGYIFIRNAKWGKERKVGLPLEASLALKHLPRESEYVFSLTRKSVSQCVRRVAIAAGVEAYPHALRRGFVTTNVAKGKPLPYIQQACGHSDISVTRMYCKETEEEVVEAMQAW